MKQANMVMDSCGTEWDVVRKVIASAYFSNAARLKGLGEYVNVRTGMPCHLHPTSALYGLGFTPDYIVYHELVMTTREFMHCVTAVDAEWLAELGPALFAVKRDFGSRCDTRRHDREDAARMEAELAKAQDAIAARARDEDAKWRASVSRHSKIATPGRYEPGTPRRTPFHSGI
eukprot:TRINITY_DN707_c0_g1_i6.p3 TRINITY_DN707_c0_g1~~TRINITY_DN707_c0_g1_i6.p3  ORF type:complete len:174 (+),score=56.78 TRINITY_DN707_c0_g1_i6:54-575(+)